MDRIEMTASFYSQLYSQDHSLKKAYTILLVLQSDIGKAREHMKPNNKTSYRACDKMVPYVNDSHTYIRGFKKQEISAYSTSFCGTCRF
jgi:hypothetical protein